MKTKSYTAVYAGFVVFAAAYLWRYLPQGFSLYDDAYLLGLAQRIVGGDALYRDISYLRTPLSPLIQAGWLALFGEKYTVLFSRVVWAGELCALIMAMSWIYRESLNRIVVFLVLCLSLVYASLLIAFPWYSFDAVFFSALFAVALQRRRTLLAGVFAGLAFMCKQSFGALIPFTIGMWAVARVLRGKDWREVIPPAIGALSGWAGAVIVVGALVSFWVPPSEFWRYVFTLPAEVNDLSAGFFVWQDIPKAFAGSWAPLLLVIVSLALDRGRGYGIVGIGITVGLFWNDLIEIDAAFPQFVTALTYTLFFLWLAGQWFQRWSADGGREDTGERGERFISIGVAVAYCAGMNYSGVIFSHTGAVLTIPLVVYLVSRVSHMSETLFFEGRSTRVQSEEVSTQPKRHFFQAGLALALLAVAIVAHERFPYLESPRKELTTGFSTPALAGLRSFPARVAEIDSLVELTQAHSSPGDSVLAFPEPTCLNYLSGRRAYGPVQWWYRREFTKLMADSVAAEMRRNPPALVVKGREMHADVHRKGAAILSTLADRFTTIDSVGGYYILRPRTPVDMASGDADDGES